ncbi:MAG: hypothetical protein FJZ64_02855, partial [Chlamydiae bacterium]|nr:hypothetical protein [Chlamydiota bacterium]
VNTRTPVNSRSPVNTRTPVNSRTPVSHRNHWNRSLWLVWLGTATTASKAL